jgi:hypothetical protein
VAAVHSVLAGLGRFRQIEVAPERIVMSLSETQSEHDCAACAEARIPFPESTPCLPVLHICSESALEVIYSEREAIEAALAEPEDQFYDTRGIPLTLVENEDGEPRLEAGGEGHPAEVKRMLLAIVRRIFAEGELDECEAAEGEEFVCWLDGAPNLAYAMYAAAPAPVVYDDIDGRCRSGCTLLERKNKANNCCAGA